MSQSLVFIDGYRDPEVAAKQMTGMLARAARPQAIRELLAQAAAGELSEEESLALAGHFARQIAQVLPELGRPPGD
jgi:hypothetical protein